MPWIVVAEAEHGQRDGFGYDHKKRVLKEQRIGCDLAAVDQLEELCPQLSFQRDSRIFLQFIPKRPKTVIGAPERRRILPKLETNSESIGKQRSLERDGSVQPREKNFHLLGIERRVFQLYELIAAALEYDPLQSVGSDADEALAFFALAISEIVRHAPDNIVPFQIEVPLCLENSAPDQGIKTALHLGNPPLEIECAEFNTKFLDQNLPKVGFHLVMSRAGGEMPQQFAGARIVRQRFLNLSQLGRDGCLQRPNLVDNGPECHDSC